MVQPGFKFCPQCQGVAFLNATHCPICGRKFHTQYTTPDDSRTIAFNRNGIITPPPPVLPHARPFNWWILVAAGFATLAVLAFLTK